MSLSSLFTSYVGTPVSTFAASVFAKLPAGAQDFMSSAATSVWNALGLAGSYAVQADASVAQLPVLGSFINALSGYTGLAAVNGLVLAGSFAQHGTSQFKSVEGAKASLKAEGVHVALTAAAVVSKALGLDTLSAACTVANVAFAGYDAYKAGAYSKVYSSAKGYLATAWNNIPGLKKATETTPTSPSAVDASQNPPTTTTPTTPNM